MLPNTRYMQLTGLLSGFCVNMNVHRTTRQTTDHCDLICTCMFLCPKYTSCKRKTYGYLCNRLQEKLNVDLQSKPVCTIYAMFRVHALLALTQLPVSPVDVVAKHSHCERMDDRVNDSLPVVTLQVRSLYLVPETKSDKNNVQCLGYLTQECFAKNAITWYDY